MSELWGILVLIVVMAHVVHLVDTGRWKFFSPLNAFYAGMIVYFTLGYSSQCDWLRQRYGAETVNMVGMLAVTAALCVMIGYGSRGAERTARALKPLPEFDNRRVMIAGFAWIVIGHICQAYVISRSGGFRAFFSTFKPDSQASGSASVLITLTTTFIYLMTHGAFLAVIATGLLKIRTAARTMAVGYAAFHGIYLFYTGSRSRTMDFAAAILIAFYFSSRKNPPARVLIAAAAAILVAVPIQRAYRHQFKDFSLNLGKVSVPEMIQNIRDSYWLPEDEPSYGSETAVACAVVRNVPSKVPYNYGRMTGEFVTRSVPRALWSGKIYPAGVAWDRIYRRLGGHGYVNKAGLMSGPAPSFVGYWYYWGGWIAVVLGGLASGFLFKVLDSYTSAQADNSGAAFMARIFCYAGFTHATHPFDFIHMLLPMLPVFVLTGYLCMARGRDPAAPPEAVRQ